MMKRTLERLSDLLDRARVDGDLPALAAATATSEGLVASAVSGVRRCGSSEAFSINDLFHIGSCTKAMTATAIAAMVERGHLHWDMTLGRTFPDLDSSMAPAFRNATLHQLLTFRAGIPPFTARAQTDSKWSLLDDPGTAEILYRTLFDCNNICSMQHTADVYVKSVER